MTTLSARNTARAAISAARDRHVDEPTIEYAGRRYPESELRRLQDAGALDTLGILAVGVPYFLRALEAARAPAFGPPNRLLIVEGLDWGDGLPLATDYLLPAGWTLTRVNYGFEDAPPDEEGAGE